MMVPPSTYIDCKEKKKKKAELLYLKQLGPIFSPLDIAGYAGTSSEPN